MYDDYYEVVLPQPLIWKDVVGYEGLYQVSNYGDLKNYKTGKVLVKNFDKYGVNHKGLMGKDGKRHGHSVCKIMVAAFKPNCKYLEHRNGHLAEDYLWNLVYIDNYTPLYNDLSILNEDVLTKELLKTLFEYREDGYLIWKKRPPEHFYDLSKYRVFNTINAGKVAGYYNKRTDSKRSDFGYWRTAITLGKCLKHFKLHRLIFKLHYGYLPDIVDHADGDQNNNRIENLRSGNVQENSCNLRLNINNTSGYKGVSFIKTRKTSPWKVGIVCKGVTYFLGFYNTKEEAAFAYNLAAKVLHREFASLNDVEFKHEDFEFKGKFFNDIYPRLLEDYNNYKRNMIDE